MVTPKSTRLVKSLLIEICNRLHVPGRRFQPRRRIESAWSVSNRTADAALRVLLEGGVLVRAGRRTIVLAADGIDSARGMLARLPEDVAALPMPGHGLVKDRPDQPRLTGVQGLRYERLVKSLLMEIAGGGTLPSRRRVERKWGVSRVTVERAFVDLGALGVVKRDLRGRCILRAGAITRACLFISRLPFDALPIVDSWKSRRNFKLHGEARSDGFRLVVFHPGYPVNRAELSAAANALPLSRLEPLLHPKRDLVAFLHEATRQKCETYFADNNGSADSVDRFNRLLRRVGADGAAIINPQKYETSEGLLASLRDSGLSFITVLNHCNTLADASIECNDSAAGYAAMKVLLDHGHRDVLLISKKPSRHNHFVQLCENGAMACLSDSGLLGNVRLRKRSADRQSSESTRMMLEPVFRNRSDWPSAILFLDTLPLVGVDRIMAEAGVRVPRDVSVIACGPPAHRSAIYGFPDVMGRDKTEIGAAAASQLIRLIRGDPVPRTIQIETRYIQRGTVTEAKG